MSSPPLRPPVAFVGRSSELQQFRAFLDDVVQCQDPRFVFVSGDYGIGKTVLVERFLSQVAATLPSIVIAQGKCAMETESSGLVPFAQILRGLARQQSGPKQLADKLKDARMWEFLTKVAPAWLDIVTAGVAGAVVTTAEAGAKLVKPSFSSENTFVQFTNALAELTDDRTALVFIDDLHWADESSLRLLFHIANNLTDRAVMFLIAFRPVEGLQTGHNARLLSEIHANMLRLGAREIELKQGIDVREYIRARYGAYRFPESLISEVQERTGGHPLLVHDLFSWWQEIKLIQEKVRADGVQEWCMARDASVSIEILPSTGAVLEERIRLLDPQLRDELIRASVQGTDFIAQVITNILSLDEFQVASDLELLEQGYRLITQQGTQRLGSMVLDLYSFTHAHYREHIYSRLSNAQRRLLHKKVGACLLELYQGNPAVAGQLARHFKEAGEFDEAIKYARQAAEFEQSRYAWLEGEQWCRFGLSLVRQLSQANLSQDVREAHFALLWLSGWGYEESGEVTRARDRLLDALALGEEFGADPRLLGRLYSYLADVYDEMELYAEGLQVAARGRNYLEGKLPEHSEELLALRAEEAFLVGRMNDLPRSIALLEEVIAELARCPTTPFQLESLSGAYNTLGIILDYCDRTPEAIVAYRKAIELASDTDKDYALCNLADASITLGDLEAARQALSEAIELGRRTGDQGSIAYAKYVTGLLLLEENAVESALLTLQEAIACEAQRGSGYGIVYPALALAYLFTGQPNRGLEHAVAGVEHASNAYRRARALEVLGRVKAAQHAWPAAEAAFNEGIEVAQQHGERFAEACVRRGYGIELAIRGKVDEARAMLAKALELFTTLRFDYQARKTSDLLQNLDSPSSRVARSAPGSSLAPF